MEELVDAMVKSIDVNAVTSDGVTPLHYTCLLFCFFFFAFFAFFAFFFCFFCFFCFFFCSIF